MKSFKSDCSDFAGYDLKPFSDLELAMVMGGGGDGVENMFLDDDNDLDVIDDD